MNTAKIAFINFIYGMSGGAEQKFKEKAAKSKDLSLNIDFFWLNKTKDLYKDLVHYKRLRKLPFPFSIFEGTFFSYNLIRRTVNLDVYDLFILRYPKADFSGIRFFNKNNVITEHHTDELSELKALLKTTKSLKNALIILMKYINEVLFGKKILRKCKGIIAVTDELRMIEETKALFKVPGVTISNGINVNNTVMTGFKKFNGKDLDLVFVANSLAPWHGIERLMQSMSYYKGPVKIKLHVVGNINRMSFSPFHHDIDVQFHGYKAGHELDKLLASMNLGIASLGLYHNKMKEACPLKTREYTARGLPFVIAYIDPDLQQVDNKNRFFIEFENDQSMIDMELIVQFADQVSKNKEISTYMRYYALKHMDWSAKMVKYSEFIEKVANL